MSSFFTLIDGEVTVEVKAGTDKDYPSLRVVVGEAVVFPDGVYFDGYAALVVAGRFVGATSHIFFNEVGNQDGLFVPPFSREGILVKNGSELGRGLLRNKLGGQLSRKQLKGLFFNKRY